MRRPNRSIEVLDISLMAVVTKAMGAFLVLMVVFMQYYSSGPIGQNTAQELTQQIEQTQKRTTEALRALIDKANPEDIARLLEEARRRLEEARQLIEQLKRENNALNAQAQRLQQENAALEKEIAELQKRLEDSKSIITGHLINWDCMDVRFRLALVTNTMYLGNENNRFVLNHGVTLGQPQSGGDSDFRAQNPASTSAPGTGSRFNLSWFRYATDPGNFALIVVKQADVPFQKIHGFDSGRPLTLSKQDCSVIVSLQTAIPSKNNFSAHLPFRIVIPKEAYAQIIHDVRVRAQDGTLDLIDPSPVMRTWLNDQIANAVKVSP
jgi:hypothetical protein